MFSLIDAVKQGVEKNNIQIIDRVCFLIDVKKEVFKHYKDSEFKTGNGDTLKVDELQALCVCLMNSYPIAGYKVVNTLLKIKDGILKNEPKGFFLPKKVLGFIAKILTNLEFPKIEVEQKGLVNIGDWIGDIKPFPGNRPAPKTVSTTFVKWNETLVKAYLYSFYKNNLEPASEIDVKQKENFKKKIFYLLPPILQNLAFKIFHVKNRYSLNINLGNLDVFDSSHELRTVFHGLDQNNVSTRNSRVAKGRTINDFQIINAMRDGLGSVVLFSGGGIVRQSTFDEVPKMFLHIHPGQLPAVRGADGFFWSVLVNGYPSCTALYQNAGIDTGDILHEDNFELPKFNKKFIKNLKEKHSSEIFYEIIYRSILNFYDPIMRAVTLSAVLNNAFNGEDNDALSLRKQSLSEGRNYHFMHKNLRNKIIDGLLKR